MGESFLTGNVYLSTEQEDYSYLWMWTISNCRGYCENCTTMGLRLARLRCVGFSKEENSPGKPDAKSLGIDSKSTVHQVYATSSKYPGKQRTIAWKNTSQTSSSAKSLRYAFEDQSHEETERQQRCARSKAWNLSKNIFKLKEKDRATFYPPAEEWVLPAASTKEPLEREFVVDSGVSMHMVSKRDLNSAELETMRTSRSPTTVMTANGEVQTRKEATENVKQLDLFVKVMLLEETPTVLSLEKLCEDHGFPYHWTSGQKPHLIRKGKRSDCNISNFVPFVVPGLSTSSSTTHSLTSSFIFFTTGFRI